ncbi:MAG: substrate-binding domain-containing protein [Candidatus Competibacterales bacterium]|nr:substrate-binding domain-containing protein [Candidatus Competibacterales bacterium]
MRILKILSATLLGLMVSTGAALAQEGERFITVASTTSTENSGLFGFLLPEFTEQTGIEVRVVAVGTGQAIRLAENGDADMLFVHHTPSEKQFVAEGYGVERFDVMYNDFVIVGPGSDPAGVAGLEDATAALAMIAEAESPFASRGDDSGTHKKELGLWEQAGIDPTQASGSWYRETGSGMGPTLNTASGMNAYALSDRATWLNFGNKGELEILVEGDPRLFNQYGIILVNPERYPHVKAEMGQTFIDWVLSEEGQELIGEYTIQGQQAFFPNAGTSD